MSGINDRRDGQTYAAVVMGDGRLITNDNLTDDFEAFRLAGRRHFRCPEASAIDDTKDPITTHFGRRNREHVIVGSTEYSL